MTNFEIRNNMAYASQMQFEVLRRALMGVRIQADGGGEFNNQKLCWDKSIILSFSPAHQPSSNGIAERMVGILKSMVRRMLKQALLEREW